MPCRSRSGIALILTAGLLGLLGLLAVLFLEGARCCRPGDVGTVNARLAAESGMHYARGRLRERNAPGDASDPAARGDDWTFREGFLKKLSGAARPSYAHDGNGLFDARSGRLRGGGPAASGFSLKITAPAGEIPVNTGNAQPAFWNKPSMNLALDRLLNNLGALLLALNPQIGRLDVVPPPPVGSAGTPPEAIRVSRLGTHLIQRRPTGGYASLAHVRQALLTGTPAYSPAECDAVLPFLDPGPYETLGEYGCPYPLGDSATLGNAAISLLAAPLEILSSLWMYGSIAPIPAFALDSNPSFQRPYGHGGFRAGGNIEFRDAVVTIFPDEAMRLADWAAGFRNLPERFSWLAFRKSLVASARDLVVGPFSAEATLLSQGAADDWVRTKADLAFLLVSPDIPAQFSCSSWQTGAIDHGPPGPAIPATRPFAGTPFLDPSDIQRPDAAGQFPPPAFPFQFLGPSFQSYPLTLAPPGRFDVESLGVSGGNRQTFRGAVRVSDRIELTSQEDFENIRGKGVYSRLLNVFPVGRADRGPFRDDPCPDLAAGGIVDPTPSYPRVSTWPDGVQDDYPVPNQLPFNTRNGGITLAARGCGQQGADLYWGFQEDADAVLSSEFSASGPSGHSPFQYPDGNGSLLGYGADYTFVRNPGALPALPMPLSGTRIDSFSIEGWVTPNLKTGIVWKISCSGNSDFGLTLESATDYQPASGGYGILYSLCVDKWIVEHPLDPTAPKIWGAVPVSVFVPFYDPSTGRTRDLQDHVVVVIERHDLSNETVFSLHANGTFSASASHPVFLTWSNTDHVERIELWTCDEVRMYGTALSQAQAFRIHDQLGRFAVPPAGGPDPLYRSPLYVLDAPGRLKQANWTGIPAGEPPGQERIGIRVRVRGYLDAAGSAEVPASPLALADTFSLSDLSDLGPVRSFRYEVEFRNLAPPGSAPGDPLFKTPVFESIWFTLARAGRCGWSDWTGP